jgi:hypothetical protein
MNRQGRQGRQGKIRRISRRNHLLLGNGYKLGSYVSVDGIMICYIDYKLNPVNWMYIQLIYA